MGWVQDFNSGKSGFVIHSEIKSHNKNAQRSKEEIIKDEDM